MADIILISGLHAPMLTLPRDLWPAYAQRDAPNPEARLPAPRRGDVYQEALASVAPGGPHADYRSQPFREQAETCQRALDGLRRTLREVDRTSPSSSATTRTSRSTRTTCPALAVYWGDTAPLIPRQVRGIPGDRRGRRGLRRDYGDVAMDVPVASRFGRFLIEYLVEHEFDVAHIAMSSSPTAAAWRGGIRPGRASWIPCARPRRTSRVCPTPSPSSSSGCSTTTGRLLPVFQNTCYPPNQPTRRAASLSARPSRRLVAESSRPGRGGLGLRGVEPLRRR